MARVSDLERDLLIRTVIGEAANQPEPGQRAVAHVALNRVASGDYGGKTLGDVLLAKKQFEPWETRANELMAIPVASPVYQKTAALVDTVLSGESQDPTGGATYFLNPDIVRKRTGALPKWAQGPGQQIGQHVFFGGKQVTQMQPKSMSDDDLLAMLGGSAATPVMDDAAIEALLLSGAEKDVSGISGFAEQVQKDDPLAEAVPTPAREVAGTLESLGAGGKQGLMDTVNTLAQGYGWTREQALGFMARLGLVDEATAKQAAAENARLNQIISRENKLFDESYGDSGAATVGRIGGNLISTAPLMATGAGAVGAGGSALLRASPAVARAVTATGRAGQVASRIGKGAVAGATGTGLTSAASDEPLENQLLMGAGTGALLAGGAPLAVKAGRAVENRVLSGGRLDRETAELADLARSRFNITPRAGQLSDSKFVQFMDSALSRIPLTGYAGLRKQQQSAFNRAVARTMGATADRITPRVMAQTKSRLGREFDDFAANVTIRADQQFVDDLVRTADEAASVLTGTELQPLQRMMVEIGRKVRGGGGMLDGKVYQSLTRKGTPLDRLQQSKDPNIRFYAAKIRDALDDVMERSAPQAMKDKISTARAQWKAMKTVEDLAEKAPTGDISPALLLGQVRKSYSNMAYGGGGDLADLSRIGQRFMKEPPTSGTSERQLVHRLLEYAGAGGAGAAALYNPIPAAAAAGMGALGLGAARLASSPLRSKFIANRLINSGLRGGGQSPRFNRLLDFAERAVPYLPAPGAISVQRSR